MKFAALFIGVITLISSSISLKITCNYVSTWYGYSCAIAHIQNFSEHDFTVTEVTGQHLRGYTSQNVKTIDGRQKTISRFLLNLTKFFSNLDTIMFEKGMTEIHKEELAYYQHLKRLYLSFNELEVIESNLFINNPKLELIYIGVNKIHTVYPNVFDGLTNLVSLRFQNNTCYNGLVDHNRIETIKLAQNIYKNCAPSSASTQCGSEILTMIKEVQKLVTELREWKKETLVYMEMVKESCNAD